MHSMQVGPWITAERSLNLSESPGRQVPVLLPECSHDCIGSHEDLYVFDSTVPLIISAQ